MNATGKRKSGQMWHKKIAILVFSCICLRASAAPRQTVEQISSKFRENMQTLVAGYSRSLIAYLKKYPSADDFPDGLKALERLDISTQEMLELRDTFQIRSVKVEARLNASDDTAQKLACLDELLSLGRYLDNDDSNKLRLLQEKYTLVLKLPDEEKRAEEAFGDEGVVTTLLAEYQQTRQKHEGIALLKRVKTDFPKLNAEALNRLTKTFAEMDAVGEPFAIRFKSLEGKDVDIAAFKGKVVLVDFWATWCGPCMKELPETVALYEKFHAQGLEIIGVSLDKERAALEKVLASNKIPWPQFFDGRAWQNKIAAAHGITSIPASFLVDQNSMLTATNLRGHELEEKVAELLHQKPVSKK